MNNGSKRFAALFVGTLRFVRTPGIRVPLPIARPMCRRSGRDLTLMLPQAFQPEPILYLPLPADLSAAPGKNED
jgi:hypothetical protein